MQELDIAAVAERSGLPASTLRYYEAQGLIRSVGRNGLRRVFDSGVLERLALIALGRSAGFRLDEIARMFGADGKPRIDRRLLAAKATELAETIDRLEVLRKGLLHAAACPAPSHMECPRFRRIVRTAASRPVVPVQQAFSTRRAGPTIGSRKKPRHRKAPAGS
ncbi:MAG TPA: helix-turn-helix domain-containing protein [Fontimonas sp.]